MKRNEKTGEIKIVDNRLVEGMHMYPADKTECLTPTSPLIYALTKSSCNMKVCNFYMSNRYLTTYSAMVDKRAKVKIGMVSWLFQEFSFCFGSHVVFILFWFLSKKK